MKKVLSVMLSLVMAITSLTMATSVFAAEAKTVKVEFSVYDGGVFTMEPAVISVSSDLSDKFESAVGYNDKGDEPTVYDAVIAAHIRMFGEDFMDYAPIKYSSGMLNQSFGESTTALGYRINGAMDSGDGNYYNLESALKDNDSVEYMFYQDASFYSDKYTRFDKRNETIKLGESVTLTLNVETYDENWNTVVLPAADMDITVDGELVGKTDANGQFTFTPDSLGTFGISAQGQYSDDNDDYEIFAPYCTVDVTSEINEYAKKQEAAAAKSVFGAQESFTVDSSFDFLTLIRSGYDVSEYTKGYVESVKNNLDANGGKIVSSSTGKENLGLYGAVLLILDELDYVTTDFYSYNIDKAFAEADIEEARPHQYHYKYAIEAAEPTRAKAIINDLISNYYTLGKGMENWGFSCDNACHFLIAIAPYVNDYSEYAEDAEAVIKSYLLEDGAFCDPVWSNNANGNSTALSMAAFASVGELDTAFDYYTLLSTNFEKGAGEFTFTKGGDADSFATKDALFSLYYFRGQTYDESYGAGKHLFEVKSTAPATCTKEGSKHLICKICGEAKDEAIAKLAHTAVTDKAVAPTFKKAGKTAGAHCSVCGAIITPQKAVKKLGAAKLSKVKKGKKAFTATWKKVSGVDGYQIQYSVKKNMKKAKTKKVKGAAKKKLTVKKLKAKKTYYVRIRAYKKINGKVQYSKWSKVKKVKVK